MKKRTIDFLSTFEPDPPQPPAPQPGVSPIQPTVPASIVVDMAQLLAEREIARQRMVQAQQSPAPPPATVQPAPVPQPIGQTGTVTEAQVLRESMAQLTQTVNQQTELINRQNAAIAAQQLENYRVSAIAQARTGGVELIDTLVQGRNPAEIDASVQFAVAEYRFMEQKIREKLGNEQPPPPGPQGTVTSTGFSQPTQQPQTQQQPQTGLSLPGYYSVPGVPEGESQISQDQLSYLTSSEAIRNGDYAKNRNLLHQALKSGAGRPPQQWSITPQGPNLAPPMPVSSQYGAPPPAMQPTQFGGVQQPTYSGPPGPQAPPQRTQQTQQRFGGPPTPQQFQQEQGQGQYVQTRQPSPADLGAARDHALRSVPSANGRIVSGVH